MLKSPYAKGEKCTSNNPHVDETTITKKEGANGEIYCDDGDCTECTTGIAPNAKVQKKQNTVARANICIYKVTDKASDIWSIFENCASTKLWQIQFDHNARRSMFFQFGNTLDEFLTQKSVNNENYPKNKEELLTKGGVKLLYSQKEDPENVGTRAQDNGFF